MPSPLLVLGVVGCVCLGLFVYAEIVAPAIEEVRRQREEEEQQMMYEAHAARRPTARAPAGSDGSEMRQRRRSGPQIKIALVDLMASQSGEDGPDPFRLDSASEVASNSDSFAGAFQRPDTPFTSSVSAPHARPDSRLMFQDEVRERELLARIASPVSSTISRIDSETLTDLEELDGVRSVRSLSEIGSAAEGRGSSDGDFVTVTEDGYGSWSELGPESSDEDDSRGREADLRHSHTRSFLHN